MARPEQFRFDDFIRRGLNARKDRCEVIADLRARYFGTELSEYSLVPVSDALLGETRFEAWLGRAENLTLPTKPELTAKSATGT